jgi:hypothetical protein
MDQNLWVPWIPFGYGVPTEYRKVVGWPVDCLRLEQFPEEPNRH